MKKILVVAALLGCVPLMLSAQTATSKKRHVSRVEIKSTANQMAAGIMAAEVALTPDLLEIAQKVYVGNLPCELGANVTVEADAAKPGYFNVQVSSSKHQKFRMSPVSTSTGAIRLEDQQAGVVWLQLPNKSMMLNQKIGQRLADACACPEQLTVAQNMERNPPPGLLDTPQPSVVVVTPIAPAAEVASLQKTIN